ncbi:RHS repeat-associated core domain-containing protein [Hahella aquimaris]|uniref:RHS repeat-associated core domain-containing protein n=1 Tax=Hahella sp. HNIBRBA332 TaxID=3015983 RepID=UPI00273AAAC4|nr:RHS repeat-associated core domain-containing protein [Hahella sp. HNIBRBA332]WLQ11865.1 RHS repeat-associated core domain-containing protein [Hahella sp. HNIBRBA332]
MKSLNQLTTILFSALFSLATLLSAQAHAEADLYFIHSDHLGTPQAMTDNEQNVVWKTQQTPFGETVKETGTAVQPLRFPGQYADLEMGFSYNYYRDYDPSLGRYAQSDPIGLKGGLNTYAYVSQNPITKVDPYGLEEYPDDFIGPLPPSGYYTSEMDQTKCGKVPPSPVGTNIYLNIIVAKGKLSPFWFYNQVRNRGPWDYKQQGAKYQDFGNFHYGATGTALGFSSSTLYREAGRAQQSAGTSLPNWGEPGSRFNPWGGSPPYGDDPTDQAQIESGINFCECYLN